MAPPLDRGDLQWKSRSSNTFRHFRLPRRTRRATYACAVLFVGFLYFLLRFATSVDRWEVPSVPSFLDHKAPLIPIRFPKLYKSLAAVPGGWKRNRNVVFAVSNLTAASKMAGIACEMATFQRSNVHLAMMGFDTLEMDEFKELNGLPVRKDDGGCQIYFHDARAQSAELLPPERRKVAVKTVFRHLGNMMYPQAIIIDTSREDKWFVDIAREKAQQMNLALIELPENAVENLRWITRLDSGALNAFHLPSFEVIIHADSHAGNLERILKSLTSAHYPSPKHRPTHITIILDPSVPINPLTRAFLRNFHFPEHARVSIRRALVPKTKPRDIAANFVESFYTVNDHHSLLVLNPNVELSKWFYHYLLYATLEYKYSSYHRLESDGLYGISLEQPPSYPSGKAPFKTADLNSPFFLHTAPNSRAALFFPRHWSEFHSYFSHRLQPEFKHLGTPKNNNTSPRELDLSDSISTSWQDPFIELARARSYVMLYPALTEAMAIVHEENPSKAGKLHKAEKFLVQKSLPDSLPGADLPSWNDIPVVNLWGEIGRDLETDGLAYRSYISTCPDDVYAREFEVNDIFCSEDKDDI